MKKENHKHLKTSSLKLIYIKAAQLSSVGSDAKLFRISTYSLQKKKLARTSSVALDHKTISRKPKTISKSDYAVHAVFTVIDFFTAEHSSAMMN